jgi:hypothetical protein
VHGAEDYKKWAVENLRAEAAPAAADDKRAEAPKATTAAAIPKGGKAKR